MKRLLRVLVQPLREGEIDLEVGPARYVTRVHRLRPGDTFVAFDPEQRLEADAQLLPARGRRARCRLGSPRPARFVSALRATLVQALGKGDKPDRVVRDATALGATEIIVAVTERSVVRLGERALERRERWRAIAVEAARQCGRGDLPLIEGPVLLKDALHRVTSTHGPKLCLDAGAGLSAQRVLAEWQPDAHITLLVGPEGGLSEPELALAQEAGFVAVSLGPFVLRTETAATAMLGALLSRLG